MSFFSFFNRAPRPAAMDVRFHTETNHYGQHGTIRASHVGQNLKNATIRFVFVGMTEAPKLTLDQMTYLWAVARFQGYIPHELLSYNDTVFATEPDAVAVDNTARKDFVDMAWDRTGTGRPLDIPAFQRQGAAAPTLEGA